MSANLQRYKLTVAYDGLEFHGWQKQKPPEPVQKDGDCADAEELRTVAGVLEEALRHVLRHPVDVIGASRTDAGVHAKGQVAHVDADLRFDLDKAPLAFNSRLSDDLEVRNVEPVPHDFDAIRWAKRKQYCYRIFHSPHRPLQIRHAVWHCWKDLNVDRMQDAASRLVGTHDFAGFAAAKHGRLSTVRSIFEFLIEQHPPEIHLIVEGNGFLYNMVRIIAGTLVEVGRGRFEPGVIDQIFDSCDRSQAGPTLPARGLCLEWVRY